MADRLLDSPWYRALLAIATGAVLTVLAGLGGRALPPEPALRYVGGVAATSASLGTAFVFTGPVLAQQECLRSLAPRSAQAGSGWLMTLAGAGLGYLIGHAESRVVLFLALTATALALFALYDTLRLLTGLAHTGDSRPHPLGPHGAGSQ